MTAQKYFNEKTTYSSAITIFLLTIVSLLKNRFEPLCWCCNISLRFDKQHISEELHYLSLLSKWQ